MNNSKPAGNVPADEHNAYWVYLVVLLVSLLCIALSIIFHEDWKILSPFLQEVGFAGIISLLVIFTVEKFSRKNHEKAASLLVDRMNLDLFHAVYKRYIPNAVFVEVEKCLMRSDVFRSDHEVYYTIENIVGEIDGVDCNKHVKCLAQSIYTLKNVTEGEVNHPVIMKLERPIDEKWDGFCKIISVVINGAELTSEEIAKYTQRDDVHVVFRYSVLIPPKGSVSINTTASLLKQKTDSEIWASRLPSDGFKLIVSMPSKDIKVSATALHSESLVPLLNNEVTKSWVLKHGMFPHQSVIFWWHSK